MLTSRPRLLTDLPSHFDVRYLDESPLTAKSRALSYEDLSFLVRYELLDPDRVHPILVLSPLEDESYVVSPDTLASSFLTLAEVVHAETPKSTYALTHELGGAQFSCYNGAARVYLPGFSTESDPLRHPLLMPRQLGNHAIRFRLAQYLARHSVRYYEPDDDIPRLRDLRAIEADRRRRELQEALAAARSAGSVEEWASLAEDYAEENEELRQENEGLREQLRIAQQNNKLLSQSFHQAAAESARGLERAEPEFEPTNVLEAVERAESMFADDLLILPTTEESAEDSPYRRPGRILEALKIMAEVAAMKKDGPLGKGLKEAFEERGLDYRSGIAESTPKKLQQQYEFAGEDRVYFCEEHIRFGNSYDPADCARIYFTTRVEDEPRFVIGHVGRHLDVITTT